MLKKEKSMSESKGNFKKVAIAALVIAVPLVSIGILRGGDNAPPSYADELLPVVETAFPEKSSITEESSAVGTIAPSQSEYVFPKMSGQVTEVRVTQGDYVEAGDVICVIENKGLTGTSLNDKSAQIALSNAKSNADRMQVLYDNGAISEQDYDSAMAALDNAQISYSAASNEYGNQIDNAYVTASISGVVESLNVEALDNVSPQNSVAFISSGGDMSVSFNVTEDAAMNMSIGDEISLEKSGITYYGNISEVGMMADASSGLFAVEAILSGDTEALSNGTSAKVLYTSKASSNTTVIPTSAVYYESGDTFVYTYVDGSVIKKSVSVGLTGDEFTEVLGGLSSSDEVITTWSPELYDGANVTKLTEEENNESSNVEENTETID